MTGIIKTDQIQGAQGNSVTVTTGHSLITDSATIATLNATTMKGVTTFSDSAVFSGHLSTSQIPNLNGFKFSQSTVTTLPGSTAAIDFTVPAGVTQVRVVFNNVSQESTGEVAFRLSTNGSFLTSGYVGGSAYINGVNPGVSNATGYFMMAYGYNNVSNTFNGYADFCSTTPDTWTMVNQNNSAAYPNGSNLSTGKCFLGSNNTLDGIRIYALGGNLDEGIVKCYFS